MTSWFHTIEGFKDDPCVSFSSKVAAPVGCQATLFWPRTRDRQVAAPGAKYAVSDFIFLLQL